MLHSLSLTSLLALPLLANAAAIQRLEVRTLPNGVRLEIFQPRAVQPRSADVASSNYAKLERSAEGVHSKAVALMRAAGTGPSAPLDNSAGTEYILPITWNGQNFSMSLDTGSSDTWIASSSLVCKDGDGNTIGGPYECGFASGYSGSVAQIADLKFDITYADGEYVRGNMARASITLAGINVASQEVAVGTSAMWYGQGHASGLVGMAYPALTSAYSVSSGQQQQYDPLFTSMYKQGSTSSYFSVNMERGSNGGAIAFGGLPPYSGFIATTYAKTPIQIVSGNQNTFYAITPNNFKYLSQGTISNTDKYIVDTGTTLNYLASSAARTINAAYSPAATLDPNYNLYTVNCSATPPKFGVTIGGKTQYMYGKDMINQQQQINGKCLTSIQDSGSSGIAILGQAFLRSQIAIFDVGAAEMRFTSHSY